jgi:DNA-directed RNA polymerase subunit N (RpoN/RPB10)
LIISKKEKRKMEDKRIKRNTIRCKHCGDVVESTHVHHFNRCSCGAVAADGGKEYLRRVFKTSPDEDYEEMSEYYEDLSADLIGQ